MSLTQLEGSILYFVSKFAENFRRSVVQHCIKSNKNQLSGTILSSCLTGCFSSRFTFSLPLIRTLLLAEYERGFSIQFLVIFGFIFGKTCNMIRLCAVTKTKDRRKKHTKKSGGKWRVSTVYTYHQSSTLVLFACLTMYKTSGDYIQPVPPMRCWWTRVAQVRVR